MKLDNLANYRSLTDSTLQTIVSHWENGEKNLHHCVRILVCTLILIAELHASPDSEFFMNTTTDRWTFNVALFNLLSAVMCHCVKVLSFLWPPWKSWAWSSQYKVLQFLESILLNIIEFQCKVFPKIYMPWLLVHFIDYISAYCWFACIF